MLSQILLKCASNDKKFVVEEAQRALQVHVFLCSAMSRQSDICMKAVVGQRGMAAEFSRNLVVMGIAVLRGTVDWSSQQLRIACSVGW